MQNICRVPNGWRKMWVLFLFWLYTTVLIVQWHDKNCTYSQPSNSLINAKFDATVTNRAWQHSIESVATCRAYRGGAGSAQHLGPLHGLILLARPGLHTTVYYSIEIMGWLGSCSEFWSCVSQLGVGILEFQSTAENFTKILLFLFFFCGVKESFIN
jgi:hypothetical protein